MRHRDRGLGGISRREILRVLPVAMLGSRWSVAIGQTGFDFYISPTGSDSNPGTLSQPWAITALNTKRSTYAGKKVGLLDGTYNIHSMVAALPWNSNALEVAPGSSGSPTIVAAVNPRQASITAKSGSTYGNSQGPGMLSTVGSGGNVVFDGLKIGGNGRHGIRIGSTGGTGSIHGIVIRNCEFTDFDGRQMQGGANLAQCELNDCNGALIQNCWFHDNIGYAVGSGDHFACVENWGCINGIYEYCTVENQAASFQGKAQGFYGNTVRYCYVDISAPVAGGAFSLFGFAGDVASGSVGGADYFHHNVLIGSVPAQLRSVYLTDSRHTYHEVNLFNNTLIVIDGGFGYQIRIEPGLFRCYNNIIQCVSPSVQGMACLNVDANGLVDYNLYHKTSGSMSWTTNPDPSNDAKTSYSSHSSWASAMGANSVGGASCDQHALVGNNPMFVSSGSRADYYRLQAGSPASGAGRSDGTTAGSAVDMGAWGNSAPTRIGCDFANSISLVRPMAPANLTVA